jgi:hypothetical protein
MFESSGDLDFILVSNVPSVVLGVLGRIAEVWSGTWCPDLYFLRDAQCKKAVNIVHSLFTKSGIV